MDNFFPENSFITISNGLIKDISTENATTFVTISHTECVNCRNPQQTVRLVVGNSTLILAENGNRIPVTRLRVGMTVNASFSSAMTRSIPPQAAAFIIQVVRIPVSDNITIGRILEINRQNRSFTTITGGNLSSVIQFNVPRNAIILDRFGRRINFSRLTPGLRVRVRHAAFMTASIPPQTTAFEIQIL